MTRWRIAAGCTLAVLTLACATPSPREISGYLAQRARPIIERLELGEDDAALRLTRPESHYPVYITGYGFEYGDGAVVLIEVWF